MAYERLSRSVLIRMVLTRFGVGVAALQAMFLLSAGTLAYWEAWVYLSIFVVPMIFVLVYLLKYDPGLLERRMRMREKESEQKQIAVFAILYFLLAFLLPGFDKRFGWSHVPVGVVLAADALVLLGYSLFFLVLRENSYASRIVEVEQGQRVVSTGPYAVVRHPMYVGVSLMYIASPLALGSYWAVIPSLLIVPILVARIRSEERLLGRELMGYKEYAQRTRYRLVPGVW